MKSLESVLVHQMERGRRQVDRLLRSGGDAAEPRRIEHAAFFFVRPKPSEGAAVRDLNAMGYQVRRSVAGFHHVLYFEHDTCLTETSQVHFLVTVRAFAGVYEGWRLANPSPAGPPQPVQTGAPRSRLP